MVLLFKWKSLYSQEKKISFLLFPLLLSSLSHLAFVYLDFFLLVFGLRVIIFDKKHSYKEKIASSLSEKFIFIYMNHNLFTGG